MIRISDRDFILVAQRGAGFKVKVQVSKKVSPKSVERNRIKRIVTEALRNLNLGKMEFEVYVKNNIGDLKSTDLKIKFAKILKNVHYY